MVKCVCGQGVGVQSMPLFRGVWGHAAPEIFLQNGLSQVQVVTGGFCHLKVSFRKTKSKNFADNCRLMP